MECALCDTARGPIATHHFD